MIFFTMFGLLELLLFFGSFEFVQTQVLCLEGNYCICEDAVMKCGNVVPFLPLEGRTETVLVVHFSDEHDGYGVKTSDLEGYLHVELYGVCGISRLRKWSYGCNDESGVGSTVVMDDVDDVAEDKTDDEDDDDDDEMFDVEVEGWFGFFSVSLAGLLTLNVSVMCGLLKTWRRINQFRRQAPPPPCSVSTILWLQKIIHRVIMFMCRCQACKRRAPPSLESKSF